MTDDIKVTGAIRQMKFDFPTHWRGAADAREFHSILIVGNMGAQGQKNLWPERTRDACRNSVLSLASGD
jgi:hypothetical protein